MIINGTYPLKPPQLLVKQLLHKIQSSHGLNFALSLHILHVCGTLHSDVELQQLCRIAGLDLYVYYSETWLLSGHCIIADTLY